MGSSFVEVNERGFWMRDWLLELWLRLLALHLKDPTKEHPLNREIRDRWLLASRGYFNGCVPVELNNAISTPLARELIIEAIDSLFNGSSEGPSTVR